MSVLILVKATFITLCVLVHLPFLSYKQAWLDDALKSTYMVAPYYMILFNYCGRASLKKHPTVKEIEGNQASGCHNFYEHRSRGVDGRQVEDETHARRNAWKFGAMHVPNVTEAAFHRERLNISLLPATHRGPWSGPLWQQLRDDCPSCLPWRDEALYAGSAVAVGRDVEEYFAFVPQWFFSNYATSGPNGFWLASPVTGDPPPQVLRRRHLLVF